MSKRVHTALAEKVPDHVLKLRRDVQTDDAHYYKGMQPLGSRVTIPLWTSDRAEAKRMRGAGLHRLRSNLAARGFPTVEELA